MSVEHKAQALAIHCIDFRFQDQLEEDLKRKGLIGQFDRIAWPGASKDFIVVGNAAKLSIQLHNPNQILIYEHEDCGAYSSNNSLSSHRKNAYKLKDFLIKENPLLKVYTLFVTFEGIKEI